MGFEADPLAKLSESEPLTEAQRRQRAEYGAAAFPKRDEKRVSELDALRRATGKRIR